MPGCGHGRGPVSTRPYTARAASAFGLSVNDRFSGHSRWVWWGVVERILLQRPNGKLDVMTGADGGAGPGNPPEWRWAVALSFASAQRDYVEQVAGALTAQGVRCFYDADEQIELWGKYLAEELPAIYGEQAAAVVVFVSAEYAARDWTRLERRAALNRAVRERQEYVLPARFDDTPLPGLLSDMGAIDLRARTPQQFAAMIAAKLAALGIVVSVPPTDVRYPPSLPESLRPSPSLSPPTDDTVSPGTASGGPPGGSPAGQAGAQAPQSSPTPVPVSPSHLARTLGGHGLAVVGVSFSPDGRLLASRLLYNREVWLWDPASGKHLRTLTYHGFFGPEGFVQDVAFSPDGRLLATSYYQGNFNWGMVRTVRLWDTATGRRLRTLKGHTGRVLDVAFSPAGRLLASCSADGTVRLWDPATGEHLRTLTVHAGVVKGVAFRPDGRLAGTHEDRLLNNAASDSAR